MEIVFTNQAIKDFEKIKQYSSLLKKVQNLLDLIENNPFETPPSYEKLIGFDSVYSRRINVQHRLIYEVYKKEQVIKIIRMWTHYE
ncbi:MAG: Txe/YoeB family addiction module toxin [Bacilli bacterium]|nr:Txe/YoeB family addiction module toxin [Bacilli bacterium]